MSQKTIDTSILIPHYHEPTAALKRAIGLIKSADGLPQTEIIICHNGHDTCDAMSLERVMHEHTSKKGLGMALKLGIRSAQGRYVSFLPTDVPFGIDSVNSMRRRLQQGSIDIVMASKLHPDSSYHVPWVRKLGTRVFSLMTRALFPGMEIRDLNGTFTAKRERLLELLDEIESEDYFFLTELALVAHSHELRLVSLPITYEKKESNSSVRVVADGWHFLRQLTRLKLRLIYP